MKNKIHFLENTVFSKGDIFYLFNFQVAFMLKRDSRKKAFIAYPPGPLMYLVAYNVFALTRLEL